MVEDGRLWHIGGGNLRRARARVECLNPQEMRSGAELQHEAGGHQRRDAMKTALMDKYQCPELDRIINEVILNCARCKAFGGTHLYSPLEPITQRHPFELLVRDYLSMPKGNGGFHEVGLYLDTHSQRVSGFKYKTHGSAKTTKAALHLLFTLYSPWDAFESDGGPPFDNKDVREMCASFGCKPLIIAAYSPWGSSKAQTGSF